MRTLNADNVMDLRSTQSLWLVAVGSEDNREYWGTSCAYKERDVVFTVMIG